MIFNHSSLISDSLRPTATQPQLFRIYFGEEINISGDKKQYASDNLTLNESCHEE